MAIKGNKILKDLESIDRIEHQKLMKEVEYNSILPAIHFNFPDILEIWYNDGATESIILHGESGLGKTECLKSWLKLKNIPFSKINMIQDLNRFEPDIDKCIFLTIFRSKPH